MQEWIHIANVSLGIQKVETSYEMDYFTPHHPRYWREGIRVVKGKEDPLSNFYPCVVNYKQENYASLEHAYQATKLKYLGAPQEIIEVAKNKVSTSGIKKFVKETFLRPTWILQRESAWNFTKINLMREFLELKWQICPEFVDHLKHTGQSSISHPVKDMFWGNGLEHLDSTCDGADYFSVLLMQLRDEKMSVRSNWVVPNKHE